MPKKLSSHYSSLYSFLAFPSMGAKFLLAPCDISRYNRGYGWKGGTFTGCGNSRGRVTILLCNICVPPVHCLSGLAVRGCCVFIPIPLSRVLSPRSRAARGAAAASSIVRIFHNGLNGDPKIGGALFQDNPVKRRKTKSEVLYNARPLAPVTA